MTEISVYSATIMLTKRLGRLAAVLVLVAAVAFTLAKLSPIDPVNAYLGVDIARVGPEQRALIAERWGLDQPPLTQFLHWAGNLLQGDLGYSMIYNAPSPRSSPAGSGYPCRLSVWRGSFPACLALRWG